MKVKKIIIKVGGDMMKDAKHAFYHPSKELAGTHTHYVKSVEELSRLLTPERLKLLVELVHFSEKITICDLAEKVGRKQEAVSRDLSELTKYGLVKKTKDKQKVHPETTFNQIVIEFAKPLTA